MESNADDESEAERSRANYRRRMHTAIDHLLNINNSADRLIQRDAMLLAQRVETEAMAAEPDRMVLIHLHALRISIAHHQELMDALALVLRSGGVSWKDLGAALGVSAQAAHKRYSTIELEPQHFDLVERYLERIDATMERVGAEQKYRRQA